MGFSLVSTGLAIILILVFAAEINFPASPSNPDRSPSLLTLVAFGGSDRVLTIDLGQWYRFVTAPFLHANLGHLLGNVAVLFWAGWLLERLVGRLWFAAIYMIGGFAGEAASVILNPGDLVDVGASGAIMALFAAIYTLSFHFTGSKVSGRLRSQALGLLAPALITVFNHSGDLKINFSAHLGGVMAGASLGVFLLGGWHRQARHPAWRPFAIGIAGLSCAMIVLALWPAAQQYDLTSSYASASERGSLEQASASIDRYLDGHPQDWLAWSMKGDVELWSADPRAAMVAFHRADEIRPALARRCTQGLAEFYSGHAADAVTDLQQASSQDANDVYCEIWLDMIRGREGLGPRAVTPRDGEANSDWPRPIAAFYAGAISREQLQSVATHAPRTATSDRVCEADFYGAEWDLIHERQAEANDGFRRASIECPPTFNETWMARLELAKATTPP